MDDDLGGPPADIVQFQRNDLARAQTKSCEEKQDRIVPTSPGRRSVGCRQSTRYFFRREKGGGSGLKGFVNLRDRDDWVECWSEEVKKEIGKKKLGSRLGMAA